MRFFALRWRLIHYSRRISNKFTLPERYKGTVIEKWALYWRGLLTDYGHVGVSLIKGAYANPKKAAAYGTVMYAAYACAERNPDKDHFMYTLRYYNNNMVQVPSTLQNPVSTEYLRELEQSINQKTLRFSSLGLFTFLWIDLWGKDECINTDTSKDASVGYWNFHERIIDIGFWNHWWRLDWKTRNFDLNYL